MSIERKVADQTSPSVTATRYEDLRRLPNTLLKFPVGMREVIVFQHLRNVPTQQSADQTERTVVSAAGLLQRSLAERRVDQQRSQPSFVCDLLEQE